MWLIAVVLFGGIAVYITVTTIIDIMLMGRLTPRISMKCRQKEYIVKNQNWLHFVPIVGFDDRYVFVAESLSELANCNCKYYNRRIEKKVFLQFWNTAMLKQPLFRNTFYVVTKYDTKKGNEMKKEHIGYASFLPYKVCLTKRKADYINVL